MTPDEIAELMKRLSLKDDHLEVPAIVLTDPNGNLPGTEEPESQKPADESSSSEEDPLELEERLKGQKFLDKKKNNRFSVTKVDGDEFESPDAEYWAWRGARRPSVMGRRVEKANRAWSKMEGGDGQRKRRVTFSGETEQEEEEVPQFRVSRDSFEKWQVIKARLSSVSIPRDRIKKLAEFCQRSRDNSATVEESEEVVESGMGSKRGSLADLLGCREGRIIVAPEVSENADLLVDSGSLLQLQQLRRT